MKPEPRRLLIVDDDANQCATLAEIFRLKGYTADSAKSGKAALEKAAQEQYAAAVIDLKLEDMSGLETLRGIKKHSPDTECLLLTGYASQESAITAINLGAFAYIQKPYQIEQMLLSIQQAIEKREASFALHNSEERFRQLYEAGKKVSQSLDLQTIYKTFHQLVKNAIKCDNMYISSYDTATKLITTVFGISEGKLVDVSEFPPIPLEPEGSGIQSPVIRSGKSQMVNDFEKRTKKEKNIARSALLIPILLKNRVSGVVQIQSWEKDAYSDADLKIAEAMVSQIAVAINSAMLFEQSRKEIIERKRAEEGLKKKTEQITIIIEMGQALAQTTELAGIFNLAYHYTAELVDHPIFGISLINEADQTLETAFYISDGKEIDVSQLTPLPINRKKRSGRSGAINTSMPVIIDDLASEIASAKTAVLFESDKPPKSALYVPMLVEGRVIGLLEAQSYEKGAYLSEQAELLGIAANNIGLAIANGRMIENIKLQAAALDVVGNAIVITDREGTILWANPAFCKSTGYSIEEVIGQKPRNLVRTRLNPVSTYKDLWDTILAGKVWRGMLINRRKDGSLYTEEQTITPVKNTMGEITQFIGIKQDVTERDQRERELTVMANISAALRVAATREEMTPILLEQLIDQLKIEGTTLEMLNPETGELAVEQGSGLWAPMTGNIIPPGKGLSAEVLRTGKPYLSNKISQSKNFYFPELSAGCHSAACAPLKSEEEIIGLIWIGSKRDLDEKDLRLLTSVADMAASAIHRATLHEQTQNKVQQLASLRTIDQTINSSLDLRVTLRVIVNQAPRIIPMDALAVLIYNKRTLNLDYAAGSGFKTKAIEETQVRIGSGLAGKAALDRRMVSVADLLSTSDNFTRKLLAENEGFSSYHAVPLIVKGEIQGVMEVFHRNPFNPDGEWLEILDGLATQTAIAIDNSAMFYDLQRSNITLTQAYDETIEGWARTMDLRDHDTEGHSRRVTDLTLALAHRAGIKDDAIVNITRGALLHDIGKMVIPDTLLNKPGKLTEEEWVIMRSHPKVANDLLYPIKFLRPALEIPYCHHEKWDGSGYPQGLKKEEIPLAARLFAVVDVYDALTSDRPYRAAWGKQRALAYIREQSGLHFDPKAVDAFMDINAS